MIDKADIRVPNRVRFRPEFQWIEKEIAHAGSCSPIQRSPHYQGSVSLRPFGLDALLHAFFKRSIFGNHKLELFATGRKSLHEMAQIITSVFDVDPYDLEMMRLDFAADLYGIPVDHMHTTVRVKFKRTSDERGELDYEVIGRKRLEYFRYGKAPNCFRVYDKAAECKARFPQLERVLAQDGQPRTFEEMFGFSADAVVTRVERQAGGGRIPRELPTFGQLHRAAEFNPFTAIEILPQTRAIPNPETYGESGMLKLLGTRWLIELYGLQAARAILNRNGNAKRHLDAYKRYASSPEAKPVTVEQIVESYRASVRKQIDGTLAVPRSPCTAHDRDTPVIAGLPRPTQNGTAAQYTGDPGQSSELTC